MGTLQRYQGSLLRVGGALVNDPDCCCGEEGCACCLAGMDISQVALTVSGMANERCTNCSIFNDTFITSVFLQKSCFESPGEPFYDKCVWAFEPLKIEGTDHWCDKDTPGFPPTQTANSLVRLTYNGWADDTTIEGRPILHDSLELYVKIGMFSVSNGNANNWQWSRFSLDVGGTLFDCISKGNAIDMSGPADVEDPGGVGDPCQWDAPVRIDVVFS